MFSVSKVREVSRQGCHTAATFCQDKYNAGQSHIEKITDKDKKKHKDKGKHKHKGATQQPPFARINTPLVNPTERKFTDKDRDKDKYRGKNKDKDKNKRKCKHKQENTNGIITLRKEN